MLEAMDTLYTIQDLERQWGDYELDEGRLVFVNPPFPLHGRLMLRIGTRLQAHAEALGLGEVLVGDVGFALQRNPDTLRGVDVAFVRAEKAQEMADQRHPEGGPDLAVEILSPGDRPGEVLRKVSQYLDAGSRLVWMIDPRRERVTVFQGDAVTVLTSGDTLDGSDVLPGFAWPVAELFAPPQPPQRAPASP